MKEALKQWYRKWFVSKKIVHSKYQRPGEFLTYIQATNGEKWVRIAITNQQKTINFLPVTDVRFADVTKVQIIPCKFLRQLFLKLGIKIKYKQMKVVR